MSNHYRNDPKNIWEQPCLFLCSVCVFSFKNKKCNRRCSHTYHKSTDASLRRFPFEAAVDVAACVDQEHDAASDSVEVAQKHLKESNTQKKNVLRQMKSSCWKWAIKKKRADCYLDSLSFHREHCIKHLNKLAGNNTWWERKWSWKNDTDALDDLWLCLVTHRITEVCSTFLIHVWIRFRLNTILLPCIIQ